MARSALALALVAMSAAVGLAEDVLTLTGDSFADAVKKNEKLIVEFYAPCAPPFFTPPNACACEGGPTCYTRHTIAQSRPRVQVVRPLQEARAGI